jgi:MFS family permease
VANPEREGSAVQRAMAFGALRQRDYRRYFVAVVLSMMGDHIEHIISYWMIYQVFHSPSLAGFAVISHWLPFLFFSVYTGSLADRFDCRRLIQIAQSLFMLMSLAWGVLFLAGTLKVWHAVVLLLLHGIAGTIFDPAGQLIIYDMVGPDHLQSAIRLAASARQLAILLGPAVGGGLLLFLGPGWGLVANVLVSLPLIALMAFVRYTGHTRERASTRRVAGIGLGEAGRVFREVSGDRRIAIMIVLGGVTSLLVGNAFQAQMPEYAQRFGVDEGGVRYSALLAANAAGAIGGALLLESTGVLRPKVRTALSCAALWSVTIGLFPASPNYAAALSLLFVAGTLNIAFAAMAQTLVQLLAPPALRGRVVGLFNMASLGLRVGSGMTVGLLGSVIGIYWSLGLSAGALLLVALGLLIFEAVATPTDRPSEGAG